MPSFGTLKADTLTHSTAGSLATNFVVEGSAKAWCSYQMNSSNAIQGSLNVSSQTDTATGHSTIAWTSSMQNGYVAAGASSDQIFLCANQGKTAAYNTALNTSNGKFSAVSDGGTDNDSNVNVFAIHGDLA